jgi:very-short-patch-repair endonuclease
VRPQNGTDVEIGRIATRSHGVVTRAELLRAGITPAEIKHRVAIGALLREHRGVYRVGHRAPSVEARYVAAVRACGEGALLRGRPAGYLFGLLRDEAPPPEVATRSQRRIKGVITQRARGTSPSGTLWNGIPVTTVPQTLVDLAAELSLDDLARACHEAGVKFRTTPAQVNAVRHPNTKGAANLRAVLDGDVRVTLSKLEKRFLERLEQAGLPLPVTNRPAGNRRVDCRWPEHRLTVEIDGYRFHNSRHAWEQDREREREAHQRGDAFRRYTYDDVADDRTFAELRTIIQDRRGSAPPSGDHRDPGQVDELALDLQPRLLTPGADLLW